jgi:hypothetical protein
MDFHRRRDSANEAEDEGEKEVIVDFSLKQVRGCALLFRRVVGEVRGRLVPASGVRSTLRHTLPGSTSQIQYGMNIATAPRSTTLATALRRLRC